MGSYLEVWAEVSSSNPGEAVEVLNQRPGMLTDWMRANKLRLKPDKMEVLFAGGSSVWLGDVPLFWTGLHSPERIGFVVWGCSWIQNCHLRCR